nr:glycosyltransferase [Rudaeicoccus suwonensis]
MSDIGGVARHVMDVARNGLPGFRLVVAAPEGPLLDQLRVLQCPVVVLPDPVDGAPRFARALRHTVRRLEPAVVHSHLAMADLLVAVATVGLPPALVSTEHHVQADQRIFHGSALRAGSRRIAHHSRIRRFDHLIAVSESTRRAMVQHWHPSAPITVIRNGVDRSPAKPSQPGLRVLSLTRLSPEKNLGMTLRVFARVHAAEPAARLTIAGTGPQQGELLSLADDLGLSDVVTLPGFVDAATALTQHDVVLQPSLADNLSYTLLDAVNAGLGVVASAIGGNDEILPPHCLVSLDDAPAMAAAVIEQGLDVTRRPNLPQDIPAVAGMCRHVVEVYADAGVRTTGSADDDNDRHDNDSHDDDGATAIRRAPDSTVVIAYYRNGSTLRAQLDALAHQLDAPSFEVVIADNEGSDRLAMIVASYADALDIRVVDAHDVRGQCHARNVGVRAARAEHIAMCDADDVVGPTWVAALHRMTSAEDVLATGPLRHDVINPPAVWQAKARIAGLDEAPRPYLLGPFGYLGYETFVMGCNLGVRRQTFLDLGGMDETMLGGSEDVDFSWRALESGRMITVDDAALIDYRLRVDERDVRSQAYRYQRAQLGLWARSRRMGRPVRGMSLRWALRETAALPALWLTTRHADEITRLCVASRCGGTTGNLLGQLSVRRPRLR